MNYSSESLSLKGLFTRFLTNFIHLTFARAIMVTEVRYEKILDFSCRYLKIENLMNGPYNCENSKFNSQFEDS